MNDATSGPVLFRMPVALRWRDLDAFTRLGADAAVAGSAALDTSRRESGTAYAQLSPVIELHDRWVALGLALQAVYTSAGSDPLQLSARASVRVELSHLQLEAAALCNLDSPLGFTGAGDSVCGAWLAAEFAP